MSPSPEDMALWKGVDEDVRNEVINCIGLTQDASEMNEPEHPKHEQYAEAYVLILRILKL